MLDTKVFTIIASAIIFWTTDVVQGKYIYHPDINRWVKQDKVVGTWEQAKAHCESEGAVLASPINEDLIKYMTSIIDVGHHESPYFIGMKLIQNTEVFQSIEGILLDDLPEAIINKIDKLDPREGDCLGMSRSNIHVVPCWARLPYLCYLNTTTNYPIYRPVTQVRQSTSGWSGWTRYKTSTGSPCWARPSYLCYWYTTPNFPIYGQTVASRPVTEVRQSTSGWSGWTRYKTSTGNPCWARPYLCDWKTTTNYPIYRPTAASTPVTPYKTSSGPSFIWSTTNSTDEPIDCGYGYERHSTGNCYKVHHEYKSWHEAQSTCSDEGAYLAIINDAHEAEYLRSISFRAYDEYIAKWIGLQKINGVWRSVHGDHVNQIFNVWSSTVSGLPCGMFKDDVSLDDQSCSVKIGFICEKSMQDTSTNDTYEYTGRPGLDSSPTRFSTLVPTPPTPMLNSTSTLCGSGYRRHSTGNCYKVHLEYKSWYDARSTCSSEGAYLAIINDANEAEYLKSISFRPGEEYMRKWIGIRKVNGDWLSIHGDHVNQIFNVWSYTVSGLSCGTLKNDGLLDDQSCNFLYGFICEKSMQDTSTTDTYEYTSRHGRSSSPTPLMTTPKTSTFCGRGYKRHSTGNCYKVHKKYKSWYDARSICYDEGAYLAIINDANEAEYLKNISFRPNDEYIRKWIGLREVNGTWLSVNGDHVNQTFNVWSDTVSGLPCGTLKNDGLLDDQLCNFKYGFICEKSMQDTSPIYTYEYTSRHGSSPTPPTSFTTLTMPTLCGSGYEFHSGSCYKVHGEYKSWDEADSTCTNEGAYLAIINDAQEAQVLQSITSRPDDEYIRKWIGLREMNGDWISVQGDRVDEIFNVWSTTVSGLPCGVFKKDGLLDDQSCSFKYRFICEKSMQDTSTNDTYEYTSRHGLGSSPIPPTPMSNSTSPSCVSGYEFYSGSCYKVHDEYKSWEEAQSTCSNEGAYLAIINDADEAQVLQNITSRPNDEYRRKWIGLRVINDDWRSVHDDSLDQIFHVWSDSVSGLPCGAFKDDGQLDDQSCDFKYRFICENP